MKETNYTCDISNREHSGAVQTIDIHVVFDHDQEDGKSKYAPYLDEVSMELCDGCKKFMLENRRYIYAYGAMGNNTYTL